MTNVLRILGRALRWLFAAVLVALLLVWMSLPSMIRYAIMSRGSRALHAKVTVGLVDLSLWNGSLRIENLAIHEPAGESETTVVGWRALRVTVDYRDLFNKMIRVRELVLDTPRIALDRLADGKLNLQRLVASEPAVGTDANEPSSAAAAAVPPWGFALDRFVLRGGGLRFRDLLVPESRPLAIDIPSVEVADVSFQPGLYGEPTHAVLDIRSEGSHVRIDARATLLEKGLDLQADLDASGLPLRRARVYVSGVGWSEMHGLADAKLHYHLRTEARNEVSGDVVVRDLAVDTPSLDRPALAWERLLVQLTRVDLLQRSAAISLVELRGASVVASLQGGEVLPLIAPQPRSSSTRETAQPETAAEAPKPAAVVGPAWKWSVAALRVVDSRVFLQRSGGPLPIGLGVAFEDVTSEPGHVAAVDVALAVGSGRIATKGSLRLAPPAFGGTLRYDDVDLPLLFSTSPSVPQKLVTSATLSGELGVAAGLDERGADASPDELAVRGRLALDGVRVVGADPDAFSAGWKRLEIVIDDARVPGVLRASRTPATPIKLRVAKLRLDDPFARLTRTATGLILPDIAKKNGAAKPASESPPGPHAAKRPPSPDVRVDAIDVRGGRVAIIDRTVKPFFSGEIRAIDVDAKGAKWIGPALDSFRVSATGFQNGHVQIRGRLAADGSGEVDIDGKQVALTSFNPYVVAASPYSLGGGTLSVTSKAAINKDRYDTQTHVTVHQLGLQGAQGDTLFHQQFGMTLSTALALLTDLHGDITLDVPAVVDHGATKVDVGAVVRSALKSAIVGAVTSPLKLLGLAGGGGETLGSLEPPPLAMLPGRAEPSPEGEKQIAQLAALLASRPGIALNLAGQAGAEDVRWLHEQKLRAELEKGPGIVGAVTGLPARNARKRILAALEERASGGAGTLDSDDAARLDEWLAREPAPSPDEIAALARQRAERLAAILRDGHGIEERRLAIVDVPAAGPQKTSPGVKVTIALPG